MSIIEKILNYVVLFFYTVWNFCIMIVESLITLHNCIDLIGGILYQPIIFAITLAILNKPVVYIEKLYHQSSEPIFPYVIFLISLMIIIVITINALIEFIYYLFHAEKRYNIVFAIQKSFYNYSLIVISLIAFWVAYDNSIDISANLELLIIGCFFFLCVIFTDLYNFLIHSQNKIAELYDNILQKKKELF